MFFVIFDCRGGLFLRLQPIPKLQWCSDHLLYSLKSFFDNFLPFDVEKTIIFQLRLAQFKKHWEHRFPCKILLTHLRLQKKVKSKKTISSDHKQVFFFSLMIFFKSFPF